MEKVRSRIIIVKITYTNGDIYDGESRNGLKNGYGIIYYNLKGILQYRNGDVYDGDWEEDKKTGKGI